MRAHQRSNSYPHRNQNLGRSNFASNRWRRIPGRLVFYGLMITSCVWSFIFIHGSDFYLVANEPNFFLRYEKLPKDYQEPDTSLAKISLPAMINAPTTLRPPGYPGSPLEKTCVLPAAQESLKSANRARIILAYFRFYEDQITDRLRDITDELHFSDCLAD